MNAPPFAVAVELGKAAEDLLGRACGVAELPGVVPVADPALGFACTEGDENGAAFAGEGVAKSVCRTDWPFTMGECVEAMAGVVDTGDELIPAPSPGCISDEHDVRATAQDKAVRRTLASRQRLAPDFWQDRVFTGETILILSRR